MSYSPLSIQRLDREIEQSWQWQAKMAYERLIHVLDKDTVHDMHPDLVHIMDVLEGDVNKDDEDFAEEIWNVWKEKYWQ